MRHALQTDEDTSNKDMAIRDATSELAIVN